MEKREFGERLVWLNRQPLSFADRPCLPLRTQPELLCLFEPLLTDEQIAMVTRAVDEDQEIEHEEAHQAGGGDGQTYFL
jgi:hypothetical protein